jgi:hypothetical protein
MAAPASAVDICNLALDRLGMRSVSATALTSPSGEIESAVARWYDPSRRELLRSFIFNFSRKYDILEESTDVTPAFGYNTAFYTPSDCLRVLVVGSMVDGTHLRGRQFDIVEHYIYTSYDDDGDLSVEYVYDAEDVTEFDSLFTKLLYLTLAKALTYKFTQKPSFVAALDAEIEKLEVRAAAISGQERPPRRVETSKLRDARRFGFKTADNTRYPF